MTNATICHPETAWNPGLDLHSSSLMSPDLALELLSCIPCASLYQPNHRDGEKANQNEILYMPERHLSGDFLRSGIDDIQPLIADLRRRGFKIIETRCTLGQRYYAIRKTGWAAASKAAADYLACFEN